LDLDLGHLERAESDIGEDLGGGGTSEPDGRLVLVGGLLTSEVGVEILEDFIETVLEHALGGISDESGSETLPDTGGTFLSYEELDGGNQTLEFLRADLHVTFGNIERSNTGVGETAGNSTTEHALGVVAGVMRNRAGEPGIPLSRGHFLLK
jgi:hypothetical protein